MIDISEYVTHIFEGKQNWVQPDRSLIRSRFSPQRLRDIAENLVDNPKSILARQLKDTNDNIIGEAKAFVMQTEQYETMLKESGQAVSNTNAAIQYAHETSENWLTSLREFDNKIARVPARLQPSLEAVEAKERTIPKLQKTILEKASHVEKLEGISKTKMAVIGGAVALGAITAYALFKREHPEQTPDTQQR